jgi:hypothetical protein
MVNRLQELKVKLHSRFQNLNMLVINADNCPEAVAIVDSGYKGLLFSAIALASGPSWLFIRPITASIILLNGLGAFWKFTGAVNC